MSADDSSGVRDLHRCPVAAGGVAGGGLIREVPDWVGAAPTKPGCASTARWRGSGERDGEEYARNQRDYVPERLTGSNLADMGRVRCRAARRVRGELAGGHVDVRLGGHGEVLRGSRGDAAGIELGSYLPDTRSSPPLNTSRRARTITQPEQTAREQVDDREYRSAMMPTRAGGPGQISNRALQAARTGLVSWSLRGLGSPSAVRLHAAGR